MFGIWLFLGFFLVALFMLFYSSLVNRKIFIHQTAPVKTREQDGEAFLLKLLASVGS
jgi:heme exporter protein D